jgi:hypothetical protein
MHRIVKKIALFLLVVGLLHTSLSLYLELRFSDVHWISRRLSGTLDIVYLGDSVLDAVFDDDSDRSTLDRMLANQLLLRQVTQLSLPAHNPDMFEVICDYMSYRDIKPRTAVVPVNMRSFSPSWEKRFSYQFSEEKRLLSNPFLYRLLIKPLKIFKYNKDFIERDVLESTPVFDGDREIGTVALLLSQMWYVEDVRKQYPGLQITEKLKRNSIAFQYLYTMDENNSRLQSLVDTALKLREMEINAVFYLTPINYEFAVDYYDQSARGRIEANAELVKRVMAKHGFEVLDYTFSLGRDKFGDIRLFPNEHLREQGRLFLAEQLAGYILDKGY